MAALRLMGMSLALGLAACGGVAPAQSLVVDCSINDDYDFLPLPPTREGTSSWFAFGDETPGAVRSALALPIPEGERCGSTTAIVFTAQGHNDWGAGFGEFQTAMDAPSGVDASGYEGISFWARATGVATSRGFTFGINDRNTTANGMVCTVPVVDPTVPDNGYVYDNAGNAMPAGGAPPGPDDCGNGFSRALFAQPYWYLQLIPFEMFQQQAFPNREPTGIERSALFQFSFNVPKDSNLELWIDDLSAYRRRAPE